MCQGLFSNKDLGFQLQNVFKKFKKNFKNVFKNFKNVTKT